MKDHRAVREQVRLLWIANGHNLVEAAKAANVPYRRAQKWLQRGNWQDKSDAITRQVDSSHFVSATADCLASEIESNGKATKLSLSRYAKRAAQDSEQLSTREAPLVHKVAQVAQIVHPEQFNPKGQDPATVAVSIAILNA